MHSHGGPWERGRIIDCCGSAVAYKDVGEGREQDAEASPARFAARRRSYRYNMRVCGYLCQHGMISEKSSMALNSSISRAGDWLSGLRMARIW